jgi:hypothetical protein
VLGAVFDLQAQGVAVGIARPRLSCGLQGVCKAGEAASTRWLATYSAVNTCEQGYAMQAHPRVWARGTCYLALRCLASECTMTVMKHNTFIHECDGCHICRQLQPERERELRSARSWKTSDWRVG